MKIENPRSLEKKIISFNMQKSLGRLLFYAKGFARIFQLTSKNIIRYSITY